MVNKVDPCIVFDFHEWDYGLTVSFKTSYTDVACTALIPRVNPREGNVVERFLESPAFRAAVALYRPTHVWTLHEIAHRFNGRNAQLVEKWCSEQRIKYHSGSH